MGEGLMDARMEERKSGQKENGRPREESEREGKRGGTS